VDTVDDEAVENRSLGTGSLFRNMRRIRRPPRRGLLFVTQSIAQPTIRLATSGPEVMRIPSLALSELDQNPWFIDTHCHYSRAAGSFASWWKTGSIGDATPSNLDGSQGSTGWVGGEAARRRRSTSVAWVVDEFGSFCRRAFEIASITVGS
jgi:hypothetical protein